MTARQRQDEARPLPRLALPRDRATVRLPDPGGDRQAEAGAAATVRVEDLENALAVLRPDSRSVVLDRHDRLALRSHAARDHDAAALLEDLERVHQNVHHRLADESLVQVDRG